MLCTRRYISPVGELMLGVDSITGALCLCDWIDNRHYDWNMRKLIATVGPIVADRESSAMTEVVSQLDQYFASKRMAFDLRLGAVARAVGCPLGFQAVAAAVGANPISIIVPCHRVIGSDGSLTGFAGGLAAKMKLLELEASNIKQ